MENEKTLNPFFIIIAIIIGGALYKQFNFENLTFEQPALAIVYGLTLVTTVYFLIKDFKKGTENKNGKQ